MHEEIIIRLAEETDAEDILSIYAPYIKNSAATFETIVPRVEDIRKRIRTITSIYPWLVAVVNNKVVGYAYASRHREREAYKWSAEVSVYIDTGYHRRNIGTILYKKLFQVLDIQGFRNLYAGITLPNEGSISLHSKLGFDLIGVFHKVGYKFNQWQDVAWYELTSKEETGNAKVPEELLMLLGSEDMKKKIYRILEE